LSKDSSSIVQLNVHIGVIVGVVVAVVVVIVVIIVVFVILFKRRSRGRLATTTNCKLYFVDYNNPIGYRDGLFASDMHG